MLGPAMELQLSEARLESLRASETEGMSMMSIMRDVTTGAEIYLL
jgi:hypothetical protein